MKLLSVLALYLFLSFNLKAQEKISLDQVKDHIGDSVTVCGKVSGGRFLPAAKGSPTFLNLGAPYPDQLLTVVIWQDVRNQFSNKPDEFYLMKEICVTGKIELFKNKPQITLYNYKQLICQSCK